MVSARWACPASSRSSRANVRACLSSNQTQSSLRWAPSAWAATTHMVGCWHFQQVLSRPRTTTTCVAAGDVDGEVRSLIVTYLAGAGRQGRGGRGGGGDARGL